MVAVLAVSFTAAASASQPKILEVTDNFGNTFTINSSQQDGNYDLQEGGYVSWRDAYAVANVQEEVIVSNNTNITLCVNKLKAADKDKVDYKFEMFGGDQKNWTTDNCDTWNLDKTDYSSRWAFEIKANNSDSIEYGGESDFIFQVEYHNLNLQDNAEVEVHNYSTVKLSRTAYNELKEDSIKLDKAQRRILDLNSSLSHTVEQNKRYERLISKKRNKHDQLVERLERKNRTIDELRGKVTKLKTKANDKEIAIESLNQSRNDLRKDISEKNRTIEVLRSNFTSVEDKLQERNKTVQNLQNKNKALNEKIRGLKDNNTNYKQKVQNLTEKVQQLNQLNQTNTSKERQSPVNVVGKGNTSSGVLSGILNWIF